MFDGDKFIPLHKKFDIDGVEAEIYAGFTQQGENGTNPYGWHVFCNDRLIIRNDTSAKTGWGEGDRKYHYPEDNRFLGLAFLRSDNPLLLPWHTTKEDIQEDSKIYKNLQVEMRKTTTRFVDVIRLAGRTKDPETNETIGKSFFEDIGIKARKDIVEEFDGSVPIIEGEKILDLRKLPRTTSIQYSVDKTILKKVKEHMGNPYMSNKDAGEKTFEYYIKLEELDNDEDI